MAKIITPDALIIGAGPAGLMAADILSAAGRRVLVAEAKPSVGRKLLMAGKSGLNLTKDEPEEQFAATYDCDASLRDIFAGFGPQTVKAWAADLGQEVFTGSSGRVFPRSMKASPLLRAWLARLATRDVDIRTRWRWAGYDDGFVFDTNNGPQCVRPGVAVLALGGGSWSRLGSDGRWVGILSGMGVKITPFLPSNCGFHCDWSPHMSRFAGVPVKTVVLKTGTGTHRGEFVITTRGIEGGVIYPATPALRSGRAASLDLMPDWSVARIADALTRVPSRASLSNRLRKALRLPPVKVALLHEWGGRVAPDALPALIKNLPLPPMTPAPLDEAISTSGGVAATDLTDDLMLRQRPGIFVAGEMIDWDAPTGGYLITGCLATGQSAGLGALAYLTRG